MDFLKTLMLYMSLTFAASVQSTTPPQETPVPTFTPVPAIVDKAPETDAAAEASTAPEATIAAPAANAAETLLPTITPNKGYKNLQLNSRGADVKKLQERLIELGYLPAGSADSVYGRQTYNAVKDFQKANGLGADGVAGDATQTHLYENPGVLANPDVTPTPAATAVPAPSVVPAEEAAPTIVPPEASDSTAAPTAEPTAEPTPDPNMLTELTGASIVLGDSGEKLTCLRQQDGVTIRVNPRLWRTLEGDIYMDMADLAASARDWAFSLSMDGAYHLTAEGYEVIIAADGLSCTVDGETIALAEGDFRVENGSALCTAALLEKALAAETLWDADEQTMMLQIVHKDVAQATD